MPAICRGGLSPPQPRIASARVGRAIRGQLGAEQVFVYLFRRQRSIADPPLERAQRPAQFEACPGPRLKWAAKAAAQCRREAVAFKSRGSCGT